MAFCNICGAQVPEGAMHCSSCGAPLNRIEYKNQSSSFGRNTPGPYQDADRGYNGWERTLPQPPKNNSALLWVIVGVLAVLVLLVGGILFRSQLNDLFFGGVHTIEISEQESLQQMEVGDVRDLTLYLVKEGIDDADLRWESDDPYTAYVSDGIVQATSAGSCTITVWDEEHEEAAAAFTIVVSAPVTQTQTPTVTDTPEPTSTPTPTPSTPTPTPKQENSSGSLRQFPFLDTGLPAVSASNVYPNCYLRESDLTGMDGNELQYIINTIYAKNGYIFEKQGTEDYFPLFSWYRPVSNKMDDIDPTMNDMDADNVDLLAKCRDGKGEGVRYNSLNSMWTYRKVCSPLSADFLSGLSDYDLALLGNTILAKNGYIFSNNTLKQIFSYQVWYKGQTSDLSSLQLSSTDISNLELILKYYGS